MLQNLPNRLTIGYHSGYHYPESTIGTDHMTALYRQITKYSIQTFYVKYLSIIVFNLIISNGLLK